MQQKYYFKNGGRMKNQILNVLKKNQNLTKIDESLEKCDISIDKTEMYTGSYGWNTTWVYVNILCPNADVQEDLENHREIIDKILLEKIDFGKNFNEASYIPQTKIKVSLA